jgi:hypothetical protein
MGTKVAPGLPDRVPQPQGVVLTLRYHPSHGTLHGAVGDSDPSTLLVTDLPDTLVPCVSLNWQDQRVSLVPKRQPDDANAADP